MTPADRPREAARVLRERAKAATPGPWSAANEHGLIPGADPLWCVSQMRPGWESMSPTEGYVTDVAETFSDDPGADPDAEFIATMHPDVALALADWLDDMGRAIHGTSRGDVPFEQHADRIADLILGTEGEK